MTFTIKLFILPLIDGSIFSFLLVLLVFHKLIDIARIKKMIIYNIQNIDYISKFNMGGGLFGNDN